MLLSLTRTFGARSDNRAFHVSNSKFFEQIFFPELAKRKIKTIVHGGDLFDNRRKIDIETARQARGYFLEQIAADTELHIVAGNHDLYWRENSQTSTLTEITNGYNNISCHFAVNDLHLDQGTVCVVPWINRENRQASLDKINSSVADIVIGHLELVGFKLSTNVVSTHGDDPNIFKRFKKVLSGHFHHQHMIGNIHYIGSHQQFNWGDSLDQRGFHILDLASGETEFIANPFNMFERAYFPLSKPAEHYADKYVRIGYSQSSDRKKFDAVVRELEKAGALSVTVFNVEDVAIAENDQQVVESEDTITLIKTLVEDQKVQDRLIDLYHTAVGI